MKRVTLTGPECCGKTSLAKKLAEHFDAPVTEEYARIYAEEVGRELTAADVEPIARGELELIENALATDSDLVIHDTDLLSTVVYAEFYYGEPPGWVWQSVIDAPPDLYLLLTPLPMERDEVRDPKINRNELTEIFVERLVKLGQPWYALKPPYERTSIDLITRLLEGDLE